jgi:hypothetical protein
MEAEKTSQHTIITLLYDDRAGNPHTKTPPETGGVKGERSEEP